MTLLGRLFRLVWGGDVEPALRPVLAVGLVGSIAYPFMGIWAIKDLHARRISSRSPIWPARCSQGSPAMSAATCRITPGDDR